MGMDWSLRDEDFISAYKELYGESFAGFIMRDSLKVANLKSETIWGLSTIEDLHCEPEVCQASRMDPEIRFFLDATNVWFYGHKHGHLWVFDAETEELDDLGELEEALGTLILEWEETMSHSTGISACRHPRQRGGSQGSDIVTTAEQ